MDLKMILTAFTLTLPLLMAVGAQNIPERNETLTEPHQTTATYSSVSPVHTSSCPPCAPRPSAPSLGLLLVKWTGVCEGEVVLFFPSSSCSYPVCHSEALNETLLGPLCESHKGCEGPLSMKMGARQQKGYSIMDITEQRSCDSLTLQCKALTDVQQAQLQTYKVVVALLCCVLIVLLLIRFTKPTVKALQSRLSDRRQNRWVGPTQSHSVSYHQRKAAVQNPDREKRLSYPALERLTVSDSREPSSNRNSGYNF
ncbi:uncharacterized protein cd5 isoform X1 [Halichoeres trimaculatus]|uniref:uncharacterized protein cd5 isoform X1 n=1 Tax=Halichoeres trimaculatus TaxID=147232 RepID=UPI003D9F48A6